MIGKDGDREDVIIKYEQWVSLQVTNIIINYYYFDTNSSVGTTRTR